MYLLFPWHQPIRCHSKVIQRRICYSVTEQNRYKTVFSGGLVVLYYGGQGSRLDVPCPLCYRRISAHQALWLAGCGGSGPRQALPGRGRWTGASVWRVGASAHHRVDGNTVSRNSTEEHTFYILINRGFINKGGYRKQKNSTCIILYNWGLDYLLPAICIRHVFKIYFYIFYYIILYYILVIA